MKYWIYTSFRFCVDHQKGYVYVMFFFSYFFVWIKLIKVHVAEVKRLFMRHSVPGI